MNDYLPALISRFEKQSLTRHFRENIQPYLGAYFIIGYL